MDNLKKYLKSDLILFEDTFNKAVESHVSLLDKIMKYIVKRKGKQLRPMFVILSAKIFSPANETTYRAASLIELLHTATLVHDDVVDHADTRRGLFSINALWKNKIAVLVGDYLLSKGLLLSLSNGDFKILEILSTAVKEMSEGELLQAEKARKLDISEDIYFEIIRCKTASLIASACSAGAYSVTKDIDKAKLMAIFGEKVGIAFQIKDDLFDYGKADVGKPTGNDIKEKKMTLPLIYTLQHCDKATKNKIIRIFKYPYKNSREIDFIIDTVKNIGGIEYAENKMKIFIDEAFQCLESIDDSEALHYLKQLVEFTIERKY
ncbi:MAG TPA: polyprenyl synthetase family protein [Chitinophagaceae bacterium]|nr:MAG: Trans-hexaprenyltranstransferase [Bacteroidetes bacterium OLB11]HMN33377.1 polyprenyl synthetase family protein [Chitinophagaceae bacterium]